MQTSQERMQRSEERFEELTMLMSDPMIAGDPSRYVSLVQEYHELEPIVLLLRKLRSHEAELEENSLLLEGAKDPEMIAFIKEEIAQLEAQKAEDEAALKVAIMPKDPMDESNVIMEIRAGTGGDEAALFAADLFRLYSAFADKHQWSLDVVETNETELGGFKEVIFTLEGRSVYSKLKFESGAHRVQRVPETESGGRIHTSAVTVAVLPEADELSIDINPNDLQIDTYRASGAGGQHVNKTSSAIRITHLPSGMVVTCQDQRSQHKNRDRAMKVLRARLQEQQQAEAFAARATERKSLVGSGDRSERIRTYNYPQGRVTDHRVNLSLYQLDQVLAGEIEPFIEALQVKAHEDALRED